MAPSDRVTLTLNDSILDCPSRATSMTLPVAVQRRLDELADLARHTRTSRNELLAALVAAAELDPESLESTISAYRRKSIGEVLPTKDETEESVVVEMRKPGRPRGAG